MTQPSNDLAVIIGNGLSIAAEPSLSMPNLTEAIRARFREAGATGEPADRVLSRLALRGEPTGDPVHDFEAMIGPLNQQRENLDDLRALAQLVAGEVEAVRRACATIGTFVDVLQRQGRGHALDIIAERSVASMDHRAVIDPFMQAVESAALGGTITIGNLNYDSLALASLSSLYPSQLCDVAWGYQGGNFDIGSPWGKARGHRLRAGLSDFPVGNGRRVKLVHLHGSLTYLKNPDDGQVYKFLLDDLRLADHWGSWRDGKTEWEPQVVLTNQSAKSEEITRPPFALAYAALREQLQRSDRWLIVGYSFRDECVNNMLAHEFSRRSSIPQVLVVTYGESPSDTEVLEALGWNFYDHGDPREFLDMFRGGVESAPYSAEWQAWAGIDDSPFSATA